MQHGGLPGSAEEHATDGGLQEDLRTAAKRDTA
jgi:hypothetical protein